MLPPEIVESLQEFDRSLNTTIPLRHHWEYIDARRINCKIQTEKDKAIQKFRRVLDAKKGEEKRVLAEKFHSEVDKLADAHQKKNRDLKEQAHSLLKKRREELCADLKSTAEITLRIAPDMDLKSLKELMETGKELAKNYFEYHSNFGKVGLYNEDQAKEQEPFEQELKMLEIGLLEEQRRHLKSISIEDRKNLLENFKEHVLEMSEKVKADSRQWNITKRKFKAKVQEIHNFIFESSSSVLSHGNDREIYLELLKLDVEDKMTAEDFIGWAEGLTKEVKHDIECVMETPELHLLESDSNEDAPKVEHSSEIEYHQENVKDEILEMEGESPVLETSKEMDIDVKLQVDGLLLQTSCLQPDFVLKQSHNLNLENMGGCGYVGLDHLGNEVLEDQRFQFESMEAGRVFEEVKAIILEMSRQIKCYVDTQRGKVSKQVMKERVQLNQKYESIWSKLIRTAKAAVTVLNNAEENMLAADCIQFAERLDTQLQLFNSENETEELSNQQNQGKLETVPSVISEGTSAVGTSNEPDIDASIGRQCELLIHETCRYSNPNLGEKRTHHFEEDEHEITIGVKRQRLQVDQSLMTDQIQTVNCEERSGGGTRPTELEQLIAKRKLLVEENGTLRRQLAMLEMRLKSTESEDGPTTKSQLVNLSNPVVDTLHPPNSVLHDGIKNIADSRKSVHLQVPIGFINACGKPQQHDHEPNFEVVDDSGLSMEECKRAESSQEDFATLVRSKPPEVYTSTTASRCIDLPLKMLGKFNYTLRQRRHPVLYGFVEGDKEDDILDYYNREIFRASNISINLSVDKLRHFFMPRKNDILLFEDAEEHLKRARLAYDPVDADGIDTQDACPVYLQRKSIDNQHYVTHLLVNKDFKSGEFIWLLSGDAKYLDYDNLLEKCMNPKQEFLTVPVPLDEVNKYFTWNKTAKDVVQNKDPRKPLVIETYKMKNKMLSVFSPATFLKYAKNKEDSNCCVRLVKDLDPGPPINKLVNIWYIAATKELLKDQELLLTPFWKQGDSNNGQCAEMTVTKSRCN